MSTRKFKAGETYRTRNQSIARIYATDGKEGQEIHGAVGGEAGWEPMEWDEDGKFIYNKNESAWDLMPETEYLYCFACLNSNGEPVIECFDSKNFRDKFAANLVGEVKTFELEKR